MAEQIINIERMENAITLFGNFDSNIRKIEQEYGVTILSRGTEIKLSGETEKLYHATKAVEGLLSLIAKGEQLTDQSISYVMNLVGKGQEGQIERLAEDVICVTTKGRPIKPKTLGQSSYVEAIKKNIIVFGVGPAGTGKTYLAVAMAVKAFRAHEINRIIITRPAVEAGEKLGFLPGDLQTKVDPYLRPIYDAMFELLGSENYQRYLERGNIEVAPLAYMRGRTLDDAFIILDEAQNTTPEQMKMLLTRIGSNSKIVITGDITQIDLPNKRSGLVEAINVLKKVDDIEIVMFDERDVVRHRLIGEVIRAYEKYYKSKEKGTITKRRGEKVGGGKSQYNKQPKGN